MKAAGTKNTLRKLHIEKENFSDTQSGFDAWCLVSSACSLGSSQKSHQLFSRSRQPEHTRVLQGTPLHTQLAKAPASHSWICGVTQAQPYPSNPSFRKKEKKKKSHRFKRVSSASERCLSGFPFSSSLQRSFLTLVVGEEHYRKPPLQWALPAPLPIVPHPRRVQPSGIWASWENSKSRKGLSPEMCWLGWERNTWICLCPAPRAPRRAKLPQEKVISTGKTNPPWHARQAPPAALATRAGSERPAQQGGLWPPL